MLPLSKTSDSFLCMSLRQTRFNNKQTTHDKRFSTTNKFPTTNAISTTCDLPTTDASSTADFPRRTHFVRQANFQHRRVFHDKRISLTRFFHACFPEFLRPFPYNTHVLYRLTQSHMTSLLVAPIDKLSDKIIEQFHATSPNVDNG